LPLTIDELRDEISHHIQDPANRLVNRDQLLEFINSAAWDAAASGIVIPLEESESLTLVTGQFDYTVPASFAYIHEIWSETTAATNVYPDIIPWNRWQLVFDGSVSVIRFSREFFTIVNDLDLKVKGHERPTSEYSSATSNIDAGLESFIRERAVSYAARYMARNSGTQAQQYAQLVQEAFQTSEALLQQQEEFLRPSVYSRAVPNR